jgi:hypothetical protein
MAIESDRLEAIVRDFVDHLQRAEAMANFELLKGELRSAEHVLPARADDDSSALLAIDGDRSMSVCRIDGAGTSITRWGSLKGLSLEEIYEAGLERTRLLAWIVGHPKFPRGGTLRISADVPPAQRNQLGELLRSIVTAS